MKTKKTFLGLLLALAMPICAVAQNVNVKGQVLDDLGEPVIAANVIQVGNPANGTVTDLDGNYSISVPSNASLQFSFMGYVSKTEAVNGRSTINVTLSEDTELLEEVVVIGYGTQKKSDLSGAVASIAAKDLQNRSTSDAAAALQGKAAGIQVMNFSGAPGQGAQIRVRGYSSNSGEIGPLLIVDGLQVDNIQYLDPSMIESMEILKDAASAAIYGAQAGNGVVLITTKKGASTGNGTISYDFKLTMQSLAKDPGVMNRAQFIDFKKMQGYDIDAELKNNGDDGKIDTDWADATFGTGWAQQHGLTFSGGNDKGHYFMSLNYLNNDGIVRGDKDTYERLSTQINADYKIKEWLTVGTNTSIEKWATSSVSHMSETNSVFMAAIQNDPLTPVTYNDPSEFPQNMYLMYSGQAAEGSGFEMFDGPSLIVQNYDTDLFGSGKYFATSKYVDNDHGSPLIQLARNNSKNSGITVRGTTFLNLNPTKGLVFTSRLGYRINYSNGHNYNTPYYANPMAKSDMYTISANANTGLYYQWENFVNYDKTFGKLNMNAMAGMSFIESMSDNVSASAQGKELLSGYAENFQYLNYVLPDGPTKTFSNLPGRSASLAYFGRIGFSYDNKYNVQANFRADAFDSSKLAADNRWGYFPSFSAAWTLSNEDFIADNISRDALSFLKVRASWGRNGNVNVLNNYAYSTSINYNSNWYEYGMDANPSYGSMPAGLANPGLKWETSDQIDLGLDARFLGDRLTFSADWYHKTTKDLLVKINPVPEIGVAETTVNGGEVMNKGLELELGWRDRIGKLNYSINGNLSTLKNEVTYLDPTISRILYGSYYVSQIRTAFEVGNPIWYMYGYQMDGIAQETIYKTDKDGNFELDANGDKIVKYNPGDPMLHDFNGDGIIGEEDRTNIGQGIPKVTYGITVALDYKGFDFTMFGTGVAGNSIFPVLYRTDRPYNNTLAYYYENSWTPEHTDRTLPSAAAVKNDTQFWASSGNVFNGSYFKFKQIQFGYTLPAKYAKKAGMQNLRAYVSLDDFFTITKYPGFDPETATTTNAQQLGIDLGTYPTAKKFVLGLNVTF
ncbi:MAG: TonB-dependent receptor [Bacteroidaceae bacterium]|nr:TonB-dependent receptor [Bacteroidaceae bacterium]